jgi:hypothetical protein
MLGVFDQSGGYFEAIKSAPRNMHSPIGRNGSGFRLLPISRDSPLSQQIDLEVLLHEFETAIIESWFRPVMRVKMSSNELSHE